MEEPISTQRDEVRRLVFKYRKDIAYLEEKEEDLVRRIQILENLVPTILVWYMWKVNQATHDVHFSQWTEEEATNKLHHLETVLKELQTADEIVKKEELILRKRVQELEESLDEDPFANICVKPSSPMTSLTQEQVKCDIALMNRKIKKMNERRIQFVDLLEDSDRDWRKTCEELVNEVNNLRDILDQSNVKLKESTMHIKRIGGPIKKHDVVEEKINDLENQTKSLYKEVIDQEKKDIAREESQEEKMFSIIQDAMDEVDSIKQVLTDSKKEQRIGDRPPKAPKDVSFKTPVIHRITEEEEEEEAETDLGEANSPVVYPISAENNPSPLVLDFKDKAPSEDSASKQKINASLPSPEMAKESLIKEPMTLSIKPVDKRGAVEVDTTTNIQLPPLAQVDQLQIANLSLDSHSVQSNILTKRASESSLDKTFPDAGRLWSKSDLSLTTPQTAVGSKYADAPKLQSISGEDPSTSAFLESFEEIPRSSVSSSQNRVLDSPLSQLVTISSFSKSSPKISPSQIVSPKPTVSKAAPSQIPLPESASNKAAPPETTEAHPITLPDAAILETTSLKTETAASKTSHHQTDLHETVTSKLSLSKTTPEFIHNSPEIVSKSSLAETASSRTAPAVSKAPAHQTSGTETIAPQSRFPQTTSETVSPLTSSSKDVFPKTAASKTSHHRADSYETVTSKLSLPKTTPESIHNSPEIVSKSPLPETESPTTATAVSKAPAHQTSGNETVAPQSRFPKTTSETVSPLTSSSKDVFPKTASFRIKDVDYKPPNEQTDPSTLTKSSPKEYFETVPPPSINPESAFSEATSLKSEKAVTKASSDQTGVIESVSNQTFSADTGPKEISPPNLPTPKTAVQSKMGSKPGEQSSKSLEDSLRVIPGNTSESQEVSSSVKLLGKTREPYEVPNTDGDFPNSSGLILERQGSDNLRNQLSTDNLTDHTLQSKSRVKDHLIKSLADQLREQARGNIWSGGKLLNAVSGDPVKTYDFDRHTLAKYLKGEGPKDIDASLTSYPTYSNTNHLNVEVLRKLDQSSLIIKWGPPPPQEVVGFQIFIDGEFVYWVHSATRKMALLQPLNLSKKLEIAVSPVDSKGNIILRSSVIYTPET